MLLFDNYFSCASSQIHHNRPLSVQNAAQYFEHREIQIIDISGRENTTKSENTKKDGKSDKPFPVHSSPAGRLILGELNEDRTQQNTHVSASSIQSVALNY